MHLALVVLALDEDLELFWKDGLDVPQVDSSCSERFRGPDPVLVKDPKSNFVFCYRVDGIKKK
jgi:hypothetical protein